MRSHPEKENDNSNDQQLFVKLIHQCYQPCLKENGSKKKSTNGKNAPSSPKNFVFLFEEAVGEWHA